MHTYKVVGIGDVGNPNQTWFDIPSISILNLDDIINDIFSLSQKFKIKLTSFKLNCRPPGKGNATLGLIAYVASISYLPCIDLIFLNVQVVMVNLSEIFPD
jgi:hypothetical protein